MWREFEQFCRRHEILQTSDAVLLALSGGVDSMVLAHLLLQYKVPFEVVHCNFQLRGKESDGDEDFVREWAKSHQIDCHTRRFSLSKSGRDISVQQDARIVRYAWFRELMEQNNLAKLLTAHHATDNAETLFINLLRGAGAHGWSGIPLDENDIIRPLLFASRQQILEFARRENIAFREDTTNSGDRYLRNRIRHHVLPELAQLNPGFDVQISRNQMQLRRSVELLERLIYMQNADCISIRNDQTEIVHSKLEPKAFAEEILFELLRDSGFVIEQCRQILQTKQSGGRFYSHTHEVLVDRDRLLLRRLTSEQASSATTEIFATTSVLSDPINLSIEKISAEGFAISPNPMQAALDLNKLQVPLMLRKWREGDRFVPLGMKQHKLISDFLIDEKVSRFDKESVYVLESDGRIAWVVGYRLADWAKITTSTQDILLITKAS